MAGVGGLHAARPFSAPADAAPTVSDEVLVTFDPAVPDACKMGPCTGLNATLDQLNRETRDEA